MLLPNLDVTLKPQHPPVNSPAAAGSSRDTAIQTRRYRQGDGVETVSVAVLLLARASQVFIVTPLPVLESLGQLPSHSKKDTSQMGN